MSMFDDPNREAVGLAPIWGEEAPPPEPEPEDAPAEEDAAASKTGRARRGTSS